MDGKSNWIDIVSVTPNELSPILPHAATHRHTRACEGDIICLLWFPQLVRYGPEYIRRSTGVDCTEGVASSSVLFVYKFVMEIIERVWEA